MHFRHVVILTITTFICTTSLTGCFLAGAAAVGGTAVVATDRRSSGAQLDDQTMSIRAGNQINNRISNAHINLNGYNRAILMTGEAPDDQTKSQAELIVRAQPNVRQVFNYVEKMENSTIGTRANDNWLGTKVRSNLLAAKGVPSNQVKVTIERSVVYLMGMLTPEEAEATTRAASETAGVEKVVSLFEIYNIPQ